MSLSDSRTQSVEVLTQHRNNKHNMKKLLAIAIVLSAVAAQAQTTNVSFRVISEVNGVTNISSVRYDGGTNAAVGDQARVKGLVLWHATDTASQVQKDTFATWLPAALVTVPVEAERVTWLNSSPVVQARKVAVAASSGGLTPAQLAALQALADSIVGN